MFANLGWGEMLLLVVVGLVVLGPERLPGAIRWSIGAVRQARDYLSGATSQLREELGPEFDEIRKPISELQKLRGMTPRSALTKHLLDGDDSWITGNFDDSPVKPQSAAGPTSGPTSVSTSMPASTPAPQTPAGPAPFDADAT